jgi:hypothetical protein
VGHEDDGLGAIVESMLDGGQGADDALVVGDLVTVERDVEVDLCMVKLVSQVAAGALRSFDSIDACE